MQLENQIYSNFQLKQIGLFPFSVKISPYMYAGTCGTTAAF